MGSCTKSGIVCILITQLRPLPSGILPATPSAASTRYATAGFYDRMITLMRYFHTLTFRVLVGSCLLLICMFGLYTYFAVDLHTRQMITHVQDNADRMGDVVKNSTHYSVLLNRSQDVKEIITTIGKEPGIEAIRLYNKRGIIMF